MQCVAVDFFENVKLDLLASQISRFQKKNPRQHIA